MIKIELGNEPNHEYYAEVTNLTNYNQHIQYKYIASDGVVFECTKQTLEACRELRNLFFTILRKIQPNETGRELQAK